jgi:O-acetyl-ADP-ribose deacetylase (regulator of RNase III)
MKPHLELEIRQGSLLDQTDVEAIVVPTNTDLMLTGELAGQLMRRYGRDLDKQAQRRGPIALGEATHFQLADCPIHYLILAAVIGLEQQDLTREQQAGTFTSGRTISEATLNSLDQAHILALQSIALPPIGVLEADFPLDECADVMLGEVRAFAASNPDAPLQRVVIACPNQEAFVAFHWKTIERIAS